jgi:peptidoglycan/LPS O-acetylase OafA/YrhL
MSEQPNRIHHLDSLRGLAALAVAIGHSFYGFEGIGNKYYISLFLGRLPVIYFFILSGFVLSKSLSKEAVFGSREFIAYALKRAFRLYPVALAALLFGLVTSYLSSANIPDAISSEWLKHQLIHPQNLISSITSCVTLQAVGFDQPIWTIRVEFLCSLILPAFIILSRKSFYFTLIIPAFFGVLLKFNQAGGFAGDIGWAFAFFIGYLLSKSENSLQCLNRESTQVLLMLVFLTLLGFVGLGMDTIIGVMTMSFFMALMIPCHCNGLRSLLDIKPLREMEKISFSFYALHTPVMILCWKGCGVSISKSLERRNPRDAWKPDLHPIRYDHDDGCRAYAAPA